MPRYRLPNNRLTISVDGVLRSAAQDGTFNPDTGSRFEDVLLREGAQQQDFLASAAQAAANQALVSGALPSFAKRTQVFNRQGTGTDKGLLTTGWPAPSAWDNSVYGPRIIKNGAGTFLMFYGAYDVSYTAYRVCLATSTDLVTWTKPNLGRFLYGGNTNNNIVLQVDSVNLQFIDCFIDTGRFLLTVRNDTGSSNLLYTSTDGGLTVPFTFVSGAVVPGGPAVIEMASMTWSPQHARYRWWYRSGLPTARRSIGFFDSASLAGPWVNQGYRPEFTATSAAEQFYDFMVFYHGGRMFAAVNMFGEVSQVLSPLRCYVSDDNGDTWTRSMDLLQRPEPGQWDFGLVTDAAPILHNGVWYLFYGGKISDHTSLAQIRLGLATAQVA